MDFTPQMMGRGGMVEMGQRQGVGQDQMRGGLLAAILEQLRGQMGQGAPHGAQMENGPLGQNAQQGWESPMPARGGNDPRQALLQALLAQIMGNKLGVGRQQFNNLQSPRFF